MKRCKYKYLIILIIFIILLISSSFVINNVYSSNYYTTIMENKVLKRFERGKYVNRNECSIAYNSNSGSRFQIKHMIRKYGEYKTFNYISNWFGPKIAAHEMLNSVKGANINKPDNRLIKQDSFIVSVISLIISILSFIVGIVNNCLSKSRENKRNSMDVIYKFDAWVLPLLNKLNKPYDKNKMSYREYHNKEITNTLMSVSYIIQLYGNIDSRIANEKLVKKYLSYNLRKANDILQPKVISLIDVKKFTDIFNKYVIIMSELGGI